MKERTLHEGFTTLSRKEKKNLFEKAFAEKDTCTIQALVKSGFRWTIKISGRKCNLDWRILDLSKLELMEIPYEVNYFPFLENLDLGRNQISRIENVDKLTELVILQLSYNQISRIKNLNQLRKLKELWLCYNRITKVENLEELGNLEKLSLAFNQIDCIEGLEKQLNVKELYLAENKINKITNLEHLNDMQKLTLDWNKIERIENLEKLYKLEKLSLSYNQIKRLSGLGKLRNLKQLNMHGNPLIEISEDCYPQILKEVNVESRRQLVGIAGVENVMKYYDVAVIEEKGNYQLLDFNIAISSWHPLSVIQKLKSKNWGWGDPPMSEYRPYLKMKNPSTGEWHIEGVHPECHTIDQALAWRDGEEVYREPEKLS